MGDVGDVNSQHPMAGFVAFQRDRVVEVASVERVDGHDRVVRQVESASQIGFIEEFRLPSRFVQHFGRELVGEIELVDDRQQIDTRFALRAEHSRQHRFAGMRVGRKPQHLDDNFVARGGSFAPGSPTVIGSSKLRPSIFT